VLADRRDFVLADGINADVDDFAKLLVRAKPGGANCTMSSAGHLTSTGLVNCRSRLVLRSSVHIMLCVFQLFAYCF